MLLPVSLFFKMLICHNVFSKRSFTENLNSRKKNVILLKSQGAFTEAATRGVL